MSSLPSGSTGPLSSVTSTRSTEEEISAVLPWWAKQGGVSIRRMQNWNDVLNLGPGWEPSLMPKRMEEGPQHQKGKIVIVSENSRPETAVVPAIFVTTSY
jgi:hypothetical protein